MKLLYQIAIIFSVTFLGEVLHGLLALPIPASIYGLVLMMLLLMVKAIKLEQVKIVADFLLEIMPTMFIPAAVGLLLVWEELRKVLFPIVTITFLTTVIVMVVTGHASQAVIRRKKQENKEDR